MEGTRRDESKQTKNEINFAAHERPLRWPRSIWKCRENTNKNRFAMKILVLLCVTHTDTYINTHIYILVHG